MKSNWSNKWKKCLIWFSAYMSFVAFALVGGYTIVKTEDEDLKKTTKTTFIVSLIFACFSGFLTIFSCIAGMSSTYYNSAAYDFYDIFNKLVNIARVVVFAVFIIMELVKKEETEDTPKTQNVEEEQKDDDNKDNL